MQNEQINSALKDFVFYEIHDGIKHKELPINTNQLMENGSVALVWNLVLAKPAKPIEAWVPQLSQPYASELIKFLGESAEFYAYQRLFDGPVSVGSILLKQLLTQGSQMIISKM